MFNNIKNGVYRIKTRLEVCLAPYALGPISALSVSRALTTMDQTTKGIKTPMQALFSGTGLSWVDKSGQVG